LKVRYKNVLKFLINISKNKKYLLIGISLKNNKI
jgi:hypothetical protein